MSLPVTYRLRLYRLRPSRVAIAATLAAVAVIALLAVPAAVADESPRCDLQPYVENVFWTTTEGPAAADVHEGSTSFLKCSSGEYALCYYSGAEGMPCRVDEVTGTAHCQCQVFTASPTSPQMVTIGAIQNACVWAETVAKCGIDGSGCTEMDSAPVCKYLAEGNFNPAAELVSTFSFESVKDFSLGCTDCAGEAAGVYAGCMTAPCRGRHQGEDGSEYVDCDCPLARGPYQFGRSGEQWTCDAGDGLTWSAAYTSAGCPEKPGYGALAAPEGGDGGGTDGSTDGGGE